MQSLVSLDIKNLLDEISYINNGFIRNIKSGKNEIYFLIYRGKEYWLKIVPGSYLCIVDSKPEETIDFGFTVTLKNALKGKKMAFSMHNSDRILEIKTDKNTLIIEMFSRGNVILVTAGKIERALFQRSFESRTIKSGSEYIYPPGGKHSFSEMLNTFSDILYSSDKESTVKCLAIDFSLGGEYAEEVCFRSETEKSKKLADLTEEDVSRLKKAFAEILDEKKPNIIDGRIFSVIELRHLSGDREYFGSINEAVSRLFEKRDEIKNSYNPIKAEIGRAKEKLEDYQKTIDYINDNYEKLQNAITLIRDSSKTLEERKIKLKEAGFEINGKNIISTEMPQLQIDITKDLRYILSGLYDKAKRLKKIDIEKIKNKVNTVRRLKVITGNDWYSKFRYFKTSRGKLGVIGKDLNQNEALIQKHTEKGDIVGHADIFGSPFGVIKSNNKEIEKKEIEEMASMIASYSSAWRTGAANLDVYFIKPEQVTKNPPSGESLKKGAFYIDGKRDYIKNTQLGVYISFDFDEESVRINVTPYDPDKPFFFLRPGSKRRDEIIRKINRSLSQKYNFEVNADYIDRLMPQGKSFIEKVKLF